MSALPPRYLSKKGGKWRPVHLMDVALLLFHIYRGAEDEEVGWEDTHNTIDDMMKMLNRTILVDPSTLESALWSCNLLNERKKFWHPKKRKFDDWLKDLLGSDSFNRMYNMIEKKGE